VEPETLQSRSRSPKTRIIA